MSHSSIVRAALTVALAALAGCDPLFTTQYHQSLAPTPAPACVEAVLRGAPRVALVWRDTTERSRDVGSAYVVTIRDSLVPGGAWQVNVVQGRTGDSAWVRASYSYPGFATPSKETRTRWAAQVAELLEGARSSCGAAAPRDVRCSSGGTMGGQRGACATS